MLVTAYLSEIKFEKNRKLYTDGINKEMALYIIRKKRTDKQLQNFEKNI